MIKKWISNYVTVSDFKNEFLISNGKIDGHTYGPTNSRTTDRFTMRVLSRRRRVLLSFIKKQKKPQRLELYAWQYYEQSARQGRGNRQPLFFKENETDVNIGNALGSDRRIAFFSLLLFFLFVYFHAAISSPLLRISRVNEQSRAFCEFNITL